MGESVRILRKFLPGDAIPEICQLSENQIKNTENDLVRAEMREGVGSAPRLRISRGGGMGGVQSAIETTRDEIEVTSGRSHCRRQVRW